MSTVEEIERAAEKLAPGEFARLAAWVSARHHELWTRQLQRDAEAERAAGQLHDWPPDRK